MHIFLLFFACAVLVDRTMELFMAFRIIIIGNFTNILEV